ncbi:hypothetical protein HDV00_010102 [Rhizophlyctis rosea]|nr:hypothetical protein HDV00_010102 [Rhizophlyctis rosea]
MEHDEFRNAENISEDGATIAVLRQNDAANEMAMLVKLKKTKKRRQAGQHTAQYPLQPAVLDQVYGARDVLAGRVMLTGMICSELEGVKLSEANRTVNRSMMGIRRGRVLMKICGLERNVITHIRKYVAKLHTGDWAPTRP